MFAIGSIVAALAHKISILIAMRVLQAAGSSSALTLGGGTLAARHYHAKTGDGL